MRHIYRIFGILSFDNLVSQWRCGFAGVVVVLGFEVSGLLFWFAGRIRRVFCGLFGFLWIERFAHRTIHLLFALFATRCLLVEKLSGRPFHGTRRPSAPAHTVFVRSHAASPALFAHRTLPLRRAESPVSYEWLMWYDTRKWVVTNAPFFPKVPCRFCLVPRPCVWPSKSWRG